MNVQSAGPEPKFELLLPTMGTTTNKAFIPTASWRNCQSTSSPLQLLALAGAAAHGAGPVQERHSMTATNLPALFSEGQPYPMTPSGFAATLEEGNCDEAGWGALQPEWVSAG